MKAENILGEKTDYGTIGITNYGAQGREDSNTYDRNKYQDQGKFCQPLAFFRTGMT